jgi:endonuclease/exonuclease/phosphatase family metal-dependent hydrolase
VFEHPAKILTMIGLEEELVKQKLQDKEAQMAYLKTQVQYVGKFVSIKDISSEKDLYRIFKKHHKSCEAWVCKQESYKAWERKNLITPKMHEALFCKHSSDIECSNKKNLKKGEKRRCYISVPSCSNCKKQTITEDKLPMPHRFKRALSMTLEKNPDIITYAELDHYDTFKNELSDWYKGAFFQKKPDGVGHRLNGGNAIDGVAIFWKTSEFEQVKSQDQPEGVQKGDIIKLGSQVVGQVELRHKKSGSIVTVYAGHLKSGDLGDRATKDDQAEQLGRHIIQEKRQGRSVIVAGDLNCHWTGGESTPHDVLHKLCDTEKFESIVDVEYKFDDVKDIPWEESTALNLYNKSFLKSTNLSVGGFQK